MAELDFTTMLKLQQQHQATKGLCRDKVKILIKDPEDYGVLLQSTIQSTIQSIAAWQIRRFQKWDGWLWKVTPYLQWGHFLQSFPNSSDLFWKEIN